MNMNILGCDPGSDGAFVLINERAEVLYKLVMPKIGKDMDLSVLVRLLEALKRDVGIDLVVIEKPMGIHGASSTTTFSFGTNCGRVEGVIAGLKLPYTLVMPKTWQKVMHIGTSDKDPKIRTLTIVSRLYPGEDFRPTERSTKPHGGLLDATLIARWGLRVQSETGNSHSQISSL
jgi:crossover junction endodeoxyribonuclease RuvC